jgi:hypothetical protein
MSLYGTNASGSPRHANDAPGPGTCPGVPQPTLLGTIATAAVTHGRSAAASSVRSAAFRQVIEADAIAIDTRARAVASGGW